MKLVLFVIGSINLILLIVGYLKIDTSNILKRPFIIFSSLTSLWVFTNVLYSPNSMLWLRTSYALGGIVIINSLRLILTFSNESRLKKSTQIKLTVIGVIFFGACYINGLFFSGPANYMFKGNYSPLFFIYTLYLFSTLIFLTYKLIRCLKSFVGLKQKQAVYMITGLILFGSVAFFVSFLLPLFGIYKYSIFDSTGTLFFVSFTLFAIIKYRLMEIKLVVTKATVFLLIYTIVLGLPFIVTFNTESRLIPLLIAIPLASSGPVLYRIIKQKAIDFIIANRRRYQKALLADSVKFNTLKNMKVLSEFIISSFINNIQISFAGIYIKDNHSFTLSHSTGNDIFTQGSIEASHPFFNLLMDNNVYIPDKRFIDDTLPFSECPGLVIPIVYQEHLSAFIVLGEKNDDTSYEKDDIDTFISIAGRIAISIENCKFIDESSKKLRTLNEVLEEKVERKTVELRETIEMLKATQEEKRKFISSITHDLKTPLSIIIGHSESLHGSFEPESKNYRYAHFIITAANQTLNMIDMLLNISMLESSDYKPNLDIYDYAPYLKEICEPFVEQAAIQKLTLKTDICNHSTKVQMDSVWIERIIGNLLQNAFKFTDEGGSITIRVYLDSEFVFTEIRDTGQGIEKQKLPFIFERKYQADDNKKANGFGLGLFIVKEMVTRMGGDISVHSDVGRGTTFLYKLPLYPDQFAKAKNIDSRNYTRVERRAGGDRRKENRIRQIVKSQELEHKHQQFTVNLLEYENKNPKKPTILICEDSTGQLHLLIEAFKNDYNLIFGHDGGEGLDKLNKYGEKVAIILSDVQMPGMDGLQFCREVFKQNRFSNIPFVFLTAYYNDNEQLTGIRYGATDYLQKPFNERILREKINHWISQREHEKIMADLIDTLELKNREVNKLRSIIAHEIRNPLQVLKGLDYGLERLRNLLYEVTDDKFKKYWDRSKLVVDMVESIENVIRSSEVLQAQADELQRQPTEISDLIDSSFMQTEELTHGIKVVTDNPFGDEPILCDKKMIVQVFVNILRNASEAIKQKNMNLIDGLITFTVKKSEDRSFIYFDIYDNGVGISAEQRKNLFNYKYTTKKDGTGIGLYFSRRILNIHEGDITLDSIENRGTTFTVSLPLERGLVKKQ